MLTHEKLRVLVLHNRYQERGGEDVVVLAETALLERNGHSVARLEANNDDIIGTLGKVRTALSVAYSFSSGRQVAAELARFRPHIVHVHNTFPTLTPSVYYACKRAGVPVVQTLHNFRLICPGAILFRDGQVSETCIGKWISITCIRAGCYRNSRTGTAVVAAMLGFHRAIGTWERMIGTYICMTEFSRALMARGGLPEEKLVVKPNFLDPDPGRGAGRGGYALYVGRLSPEKSVETLLECWQQPGLMPIKIVGTGPLLKSIEERARALEGVTVLGHQSRETVLKLMKDACVLIFPSVWYEGFPMVIVEALATGLPIIASDLGSMPSLVWHERTGFLFRAGDPKDLREKVKWAACHPSEMAQMRRNARTEFEAKYTAEKNYEMLMNIYDRATAPRHMAQFVETALV